MPAVILTLKINPNTHERTLVIHYESDDDCLPFEHEHEHQQWVERLLGHPIKYIAETFEIQRMPQQHLQNAPPKSTTSYSSEECTLRRKSTKA